MSTFCVLKAMTDHFEGGSRVQYTYSIPTGKLEAGIFFKSYFKGLSSQDQQKPLDAA